MSNCTVHPCHSGNTIVCPKQGCHKSLRKVVDAKNHLVAENPHLSETCLWLYYFYYCRHCSYFTLQKVNLKTHLQNHHKIANTDVGYHTHGGVDFILNNEGTPIGWTMATDPASWLAKFYGDHVTLFDFGEYGGAVRLFPA